jgi:carboxylesterase
MKPRPVIYQHPELDGNTFFMHGSLVHSPGLLFLHGFTATTVEVRQIADHFHRLGYTVSAPLLPGHGTTPEKMNKVQLQDWLETAEQAYLAMRLEKENIIVFGESMGALLTLHLAHKFPEIKKIYLFAPALKIKGLWQSVLLWPFVPYVFKKNTDDKMSWQGYNVVPLHAAAQLFKLQRQVNSQLGEIKTAATIFQGKLDKTVSLEGAEIVHAQLASAKKEIFWLEEAPHCILLSDDLPKVLGICTSQVMSL